MLCASAWKAFVVLKKNSIYDKKMKNTGVYAFTLHIHNVCGLPETDGNGSAHRCFTEMECKDFLLCILPACAVRFIMEKLP